MRCSIRSIAFSSVTAYSSLVRRGPSASLLDYGIQARQIPGDTVHLLWLAATAQGLRFSSQKSIILAMQELLSKTDDADIPLREQEFFELSLLDEATQLGTRYCVRQAHAAWSEIDGQIMWDQEEVDHFWILTEAKRRYAERRFAL